MEIIMEIITLALIIGGIALIGFFAYIILLILKTGFTSNKNFKEVTATIKDIKREDTVDEKGFVTNYRAIITCTFEYDNKQEQQELLCSYDLEKDELKKGDKINCLYNPKTKTLTTIENRKAVKTLARITAIAIILIILFAINIINIKSETFNTIILLIGTVGFMYCAICELKTAYNIKTKKYIEIKGTVVRIHEKISSNTDSHCKVYTPEIKYTYEGKEKFHVSSYSSSNSKLFNIGDEYTLYYNKKENKAYDNANTTMGIILIGMSILFAISAIITIIKM